ncbi:hypothetical protein AAU57_07415 [Nonlabens sp. YIK11]|uniref:M56 family metallopeptidase n=1 Tax=Nonlabens sp. YIK11 TaxID=1453349 RepID=UPI0006DCAF78|nr:M56 family metallopeptidase [Nonlabens sp. YIK11]KQC33158.1 hypothetical protein AAU57_07415 [Nonlabens sp. YIK11]
MEEAFDYLWKSAGVLSIFVITYHLLLRRLTFFKANRFFLLFGMVASITFPLIEITQTVYVEQPEVTYSAADMVTAMTLLQQEPPVEPLINTSQLLLMLYAAVSLFFIGKMGVELLSLRKLIISGKRRLEDGYVRISLSRKVTPFSFFKYICFTVGDEQQQDHDLILKHEQVHAREWHSVDLLLSHLYCAVFWLNPLAWWLKRQIGENLEFIADATAKVENTTGISYERTLLSSAASHMQPALANNFFTPFIKKRIQMLQKETSKTWNAYKYALILPVMALFLYSFNTVTKTEYVKSNFKKEQAQNVATSSANTSVTSAAQDVIKENDDKNGEQNATSVATETIEFKIVATTTEQSLETFKKRLKSDHNVDFTYKNLKYQDGKITRIKIELDDNRGFKGSQNYNGDEPINPICITGIIDGNSKKWSMGSCEKTRWTAKGNVLISENDPATYIYSPDSLYFSQSLKFDTDSLMSMMKDLKKIDIDSFHRAMRASYKDLQVRMEDIDIKQMEADLKKAQREMRRMNLDSLHDVMRQARFQILRMNKDSVKSSMKTQFFNTDTLGNDMDNIVIYDVPKAQRGKPIIRSTGTDPILIVDGKRVPYSKMNEIDPQSIKAVDVLKDKAATAVYGEGSENGVIVVTLKSAEDVKLSAIKSTRAIPYIVIDGVVAKQEQMYALDSNKIESFSILKSDEATALYGADAKDGAIIIVTQKKTKTTKNDKEN